jgi:hypothetical protein
MFQAPQSLSALLLLLLQIIALQLLSTELAAAVAAVHKAAGVWGTTSCC